MAGGALILRAVGGVADLPQMLEGAKAFAEDAAPAAKKALGKTRQGRQETSRGDRAAGQAAGGGSPLRRHQPASPPPPAPTVCAPTPAELAKQAGMSPAELQVLQSLGSRRTQLDAREQSLDTQLQLLAAAEAKVDTKLKQLTGLKGDIQGLLGQADVKKDTEMQRLVTIYEQMKPQEAANRMTLLDDSVRLPIASKMNVRKLAVIMGDMPAADAKSMTEKLADRLGAADSARARPSPPPPPPPPPRLRRARPAPPLRPPRGRPVTTKG